MFILFIFIGFIVLVYGLYSSLINSLLDTSYKVENRSAVCNKLDKDSQNSYTSKPLYANYLKLYIAVLDTVPDHMVNLVAANAELAASLYYTKPHKTFKHLKKKDLMFYNIWSTTSVYKCVVRVNQEEFNKISQLHPEIYINPKYKTLKNIRSCIVPLPVWHSNTPEVLKLSKLWKPINE